MSKGEADEPEVRFTSAGDSETECYKLEVMGNTATFTDKDGTGTRYEILKGNPKAL